MVFTTALMVKITKHAIQRMNQRCINPTDLQIILKFGKKFHAGKGAIALFITKKSVKWARGKLGVKLDKLQGSCVIGSIENNEFVVITVEKNRKSIPAHWNEAGWGLGTKYTLVFDA